MARVDIRSVSLTSFNGYTATVLVDMVYTYFNGSVISSLQPFLPVLRCLPRHLDV